jgi:hypothetical protein
MLQTLHTKIKINKKVGGGIVLVYYDVNAHMPHSSGQTECHAIGGAQTVAYPGIFFEGGSSAKIS